MKTAGNDLTFFGLFIENPYQEPVLGASTLAMNRPRIRRFGPLQKRDMMTTGELGISDRREHRFASTQ
ncbi:MAG: hypothetical protein MK108_15660 [Mariniblastus sp.]|nr:hypothetical protein [Mariniblastus sp.]